MAAPPLIGSIHLGSMMLNQGSRLGYTVAMEHDPSYKLLFSHSELMADLLRGFVREDWVQALDFTSLEKVSGSVVFCLPSGPTRTVLCVAR